MNIPLDFYKDLNQSKTSEKNDKKVNKELEISGQSIENWDIGDFCNYFSKKYKDTFDTYCVISPADRRHMKRLIELKGNVQIKLAIDVYFSIDSKTKTIMKFASNSCQARLDAEIQKGNTGKINPIDLDLIEGDI